MLWSPSCDVYLVISSEEINCGYFEEVVMKQLTLKTEQQNSTKKNKWMTVEFITLKLL